MKKVIVIILAACLAVATLVTALSIPGNEPETPKTQETASANEAGKIVIWNKNRDQKLFETTDAAALDAIAGLIHNASWSSGTGPLPSLEGAEYILAVYDTNGQSTQYAMFYKSNNDIALLKAQSDDNRSYEKADFPAQGGGGLYAYLNIGGPSPT